MSGLDERLVERAHAGTSMVPEQRAREERQGYAGHLQEVRELLFSAADCDASRAEAERQYASYVHGYTRRTNAYLGARGRVLSPMITGPSNFPTRRNQKALDREMRLSGEREEWCAKARKRAVRAVVDARSPESKAEVEWSLFKRQVDADLDFVNGYDEGRQPQFYTRSAWVTSLAGKLERRFNNGEHGLVIRALDYIAERQAGWKKPFFTPRHAVWNLREKVAEAAAKEPEAAVEVPAREYAGLRIEENTEADRIQLFFDGKPEERVRTMLKGRGWRWSPRYSAWQRQITPNARAAADQFVAWFTQEYPEG